MYVGIKKNHTHAFWHNQQGLCLWSEWHPHTSQDSSKQGNFPV